MPRLVDHDERRRHIIEALWRLAASDGLTAVSFRRVAAEAEVSVRQIQYYFGTKAALLGNALQMLGEAVFADGVQAMEQAGPDASPRLLLRGAIEAAFPSDPQRRQRSLLFFSFYVAALTDPELASGEAQAILGWTVPFAADLIRVATDQGQTRPGIAADHEARILMSAFYGLSLAVLAGTQTEREALAAIDYQLDHIFT